MKTKILSGLIFVCVLHTNAQFSKTDLSGYYENEMLIQEYADDAFINDYNKLRIDLHNEWNKNLSVNADFILKSYHGKTDFNFFDFMPTRVVESYSQQMNVSIDSLKPAFGFSYENEFFLDNAFVSFYTKHLNVRIGKQQLPWGSGYAWNPTDLFNTKNLLDPTYEKTGVNAVKIEIPFLSEGKVTAVFSPNDYFRNSVYALKIKEHALGFDASASYVIRNYSSYDYFSFSEMNEKQQMAGFDFSGDVAGFGLHGEIASNFMEKSKDYQQLLVGSDYTLNNGLFLMAEYYYNGKGKKSDSEYDINSWMNMFGIYGENLGQNYLYTGLSLPTGDYLTCSNFIIMNLNDNSAIIMPWFDILVGNNITLTATVYIPLGSNSTEFGGYGYGGMFRVKAFF